MSLPLFDVPINFIDTLDPRDIIRLERITLHVYRRQHPGKPDPSPLVIRGMINECGHRASIELLKQAVDNKLID
ncbi:hypothetical protein [uncultured Mediterranean phage]|nr:hypothetical protein [uncultured Mediterranean phage]